MAIGDIEGHLDIRAWSPAMGEVVIDLKTGQSIGPAWLQVGGYIHALGPLEIGDDTHLEISHGAVMHIPRQPVSKQASGTLEFRPADRLLAAWSSLYQRVERVMDGTQPQRGPPACTARLAAYRTVQYE